MNESEIVELFKHRFASPDGPGELGIGDDAAILNPSAGQQLVFCVDTLNQHVHFPENLDPEALGHRVLAVNLSDMAAMGAKPRWFSLSLSMPKCEADWIRAFARGLSDLAQQHAVILVGGDTCEGPLSASVSLIGEVLTGGALRREGAKSGDEIWVSGTLGDAAAGLHFLTDTQETKPGIEVLIKRFSHPQPRLALGQQLRHVASACIDLSDGLLKDLNRLLDTSGVAAHIDLNALPQSMQFRQHAPEDRRWQWRAAFGDDYELCFTAAPRDADTVQEIAQQTNTPVTKIGQVVAGSGIKAEDSGLLRELLESAGYEHFGKG